MPWESIGSVDTGDMPQEEDWILFCLGMAKNYIDFVCDELPEDGKLDIMWQDHELGSYPSLGVWYDFSEPHEYTHACEEALSIFNQSVSFLELKEYFQEQMEKDDEDDCSENIWLRNIK